MTLPNETEELAQRYGRGEARRRRNYLLLGAGGIALAIALTAWIIWAGLFSTPTVTATNTGHVLLPDQRAVQVTWVMSTPPGRSSACAVQALDKNFVIVGWKVIEAPPSDLPQRAFTETVRTALPATTGLIYRCWLT